MATGATLAVAALGLVERLVPDRSPSIRLRHVLPVAAAMFLLFVIERLYHAL